MIMRTVGAVGRRVVEMQGLVTGQPEDHAWAYGWRDCRGSHGSPDRDGGR